LSTSPHAIAPATTSMRLSAGRWAGETLWARGPMRRECARMVLGDWECPRPQSSALSLPHGVAAAPHSDARGSHAGAYREQAGRTDAPRPSLAHPASMCASIRAHSVVRHRAASSCVAGLDRGFVPKFYLVRPPCSSCQAFLCELPAPTQRAWLVSARETGKFFISASTRTRVWLC
jgi:hypothetical protein